MNWLIDILKRLFNNVSNNKIEDKQEITPTGKLTISKEGEAELASYECCCLKPYLDSGGVKTVGIGSTVSDISDLGSWDWNKEISIEEAVAVYKKGLQKYVDGVNLFLTKKDIPQSLFDALVSITYNIGIVGMSRSTFMKRVNNGESLGRIVQAMAMWNKDNGVVVKGLVNRRAKEAQLILTGKYASGGIIDVVPVINKKPIYSLGKKLNLLPYL